MIEAHYEGWIPDGPHKERYIRGTKIGHNAVEALQRMKDRVGNVDPNWYENTRLYKWNGSFMEPVEKPDKPK